MRKFGLVAVLFLVVSLVHACEVPEEISFAGIVYEDHIGWDVIGDVDVWFSCGVVALDTTYADGAYGVSFSGEDCVDGGNLEMRFSKDGFEDLSFGWVVDYSDMWTIDLRDKILRNKVFNVVMVREEEEEEIRRGGDCKELFLDCGLWSSCVDGIEMRTCSSNCEVNIDEVRTCVDEEPLVLGELVYSDGGEIREKGGFMDFILGFFGE
ncbi:hypothetical protein K8R30_00640 [archaeon]|nr:hypothetical protein [archaeon]